VEITPNRGVPRSNDECDARVERAYRAVDDWDGRDAGELLAKIGENLGLTPDDIAGEVFGRVLPPIRDPEAAMRAIEESFPTPPEPDEFPPGARRTP
jgi:hypothetical protein